MSSEILREIIILDGKQFWRTRYPSGAVKLSEIPPPHAHPPPPDSPELELLKKIAESLGVTY